MRGDLVTVELAFPTNHEAARPELTRDHPDDLSVGGKRRRRE
jgi:hypothetical protein